MVQLGLLTDRSRNIRETVEFIVAKEGLHNHSINVIYDSLDDETTSKLIKILLMTPNLGKNINNLKELKSNAYAWKIVPRNIISQNENYEIIASDKNLNPWKLIKKKI